MRQIKIGFSNPLFPLMVTSTAGLLGLMLWVMLSLAAHPAALQSATATRHLGPSAIAMAPASHKPLHRPANMHSVRYRRNDAALFAQSNETRLLVEQINALLDGKEPLSDITIVQLDQLSRSGSDKSGLKIKTIEHHDKIQGKRFNRGRVFYLITCPPALPPALPHAPASCFLITS